MTELGLPHGPYQDAPDKYVALSLEAAQSHDLFFKYDDPAALMTAVQDNWQWRQHCDAIKREIASGHTAEGVGMFVMAKVLESWHHRELDPQNF